MKAYLIHVRGCDGVVVAADSLVKAMAAAIEWANSDGGDCEPDDIESVQNLADSFVVSPK